MFHVGQNVVCVNAENTRRDDVAELVNGQIYTVAWCGHYTNLFGETMLSVRLEEVDRTSGASSIDDPDHPFRATRFRPIQERKTDISFAHEILRKATKRKTAKV